MHLRPNEHLKNRRPKCKMHTQERQLTRFLNFTTDLQRKPNRLFFFQNRTETEIKPAVFLKTKPNLKNPFRTYLLSSWQSHCKSSPSSSDECRTVPSGCSPSDQANWLGPQRFYHLHGLSIYMIHTSSTPLSLKKLILILPYHTAECRVAMAQCLRQQALTRATVIQSHVS